MEQKEQEQQKKLYEEIFRIVRSYVYEIEVAFREEGLLDTNVVCTECTREEYEKQFQKMPPYY